MPFFERRTPHRLSNQFGLSFLIHILKYKSFNANLFANKRLLIFFSSALRHWLSMAATDRLIMSSSRERICDIYGTTRGISSFGSPKC